MTTHKTTGLTDPASTPTVSVKPVVLPAPQRGEDLHVRVSAPVAGTGLPIVLFAHGFGGISGYEAAETTDEDPGRVALVQQVTLAYLRHVTGTDHADWETAQAALAGGSHPLGRLESK